MTSEVHKRRNTALIVAAAAALASPITLDTSANAAPASHRIVYGKDEHHHKGKGHHHHGHRRHHHKPTAAMKSYGQRN